jgi:hypothetical protein
MQNPPILRGGWRMPTFFLMSGPASWCFLIPKRFCNKEVSIHSKKVTKISDDQTPAEASPHIPPLTDLNLWRPWMPPRPCLDPSSTPREHFPSPYSDAGDASEDALMYPDSA